MVALAHGPTPIVWRRSRRATRMTLRIDPKTESVVVTLPARASRDAGIELVRAHQGWIAERLAALPPMLRFADGQSVSIDGMAHVIRHRPEAQRGVWIEGGDIHVSGEAEFLPRRLREFLLREAKTRLSARVAALTVSTGLQPKALVLRDTRSRWGSCAQSGQIMLSWRLVMAPEAIQNYVIAHELAHLRHFDHGKPFWTLVEQIFPGRKDAEAWLKRHGAALMRVG